MFMKALEVRRVSPEPVFVDIVSANQTPVEIAIVDDPAVPETASTLKSDLSLKQEASSVRAR
jgi:hypothetical protein